MAGLIEDIKNINKIILFGLLCTLSFLITFITNKFLFSDDLYFSFFGEQMKYAQIKSFVEIQDKYQWIAYLLIPVIYLIKFFLLSIVLQAGAIFWNIRITFKKLFQIAVIAEFLFLLPYIIKLIWFLYFVTDYNLMDLQSFYPLSLLNVFGINNTPQWLHYSLQEINLFEIIYWFLLAYGLSLVTRERISKMFRLVASSYGIALITWIIFITFITINLG